LKSDKEPTSVLTWKVGEKGVNQKVYIAPRKTVLFLKWEQGIRKKKEQKFESKREGSSFGE